jgi:hypothetical protein
MSGLLYSIPTLPLPSTISPIAYVILAIEKMLSLPSERLSCCVASWQGIDLQSIMRALRIPLTVSLIACQIWDMGKKLLLPSKRLLSYEESLQGSILQCTVPILPFVLTTFPFSELGLREEGLNIGS